MVPTLIGAIIVALAASLLWRPASSMLVLLMVTTLFGAASAIDLPALGGSSIQPVYVVLGFLFLRLILSMKRDRPGFVWAVSRNIPLAIFALYAAATAFILPKVLAGIMSVAPMRPVHFSQLYFTRPLDFSPQNITQAVYVVGTFMAAVCASLVARTERCHRQVVWAGLAIGMAHVFTGLLGMAFAYAGHPELMDVIRNAGYEQVTQEIGGFARIAGTYAEPSVFSQFAFVWFVFAMELWLRNVKPRISGGTALAVACILMLSTSTTAYGSLFVYVFILGLRLLATPMHLPAIKGVAVVFAGLVGIAFVLGMAVFAGDMTDRIFGALAEVTVNKFSTTSGAQRAFWAEQGLRAFEVSHGLGIGVGSFRSSSLVSAVLGSVGVVGMLSLAAQLWITLKPLKHVTHDLRQPFPRAVAVATGWTAVLSLIPPALNGVSPDPGLLFGVLAGLSLGWRAVWKPAVAASPQTYNPAAETREGPAPEGADL